MRLKLAMVVIVCSMMAPMTFLGCKLIARTGGDMTITLDDVQTEAARVSFGILTLLGRDDPVELRMARDIEAIARMEDARFAVASGDRTGVDILHSYVINAIDADDRDAAELLWLILEGMIGENFDMEIDPVFVATWSAALQGMIIGANRHLDTISGPGP